MSQLVPESTGRVPGLPSIPPPSRTCPELPGPLVLVHRRALRRGQGPGGRLPPDRRQEPGRGGGAFARMPHLRQRRQRRGAPHPPDVAMVDFRRDSARMLAALTRLLGLHNLALAEDVVQDVLLRAVELWKFHPPPDDPTAWLMRAARNRAIDLIRAERTRLRFAPDLVLESEWTLSPTVNAIFHESEIEDDQLRMMFSCCPPNLPPQSQLSLVLKLLCGFGNGEIAAALLMSEAAVEKQIARGKRTLVRARVLYEVASREQIAKRLESVQRALYLLFNEGYHGSREPVSAGLCGEAMRLCALLAQHPACATPRTLALMALMCFHAARLPGRAAEDGSLLLLEEQDRSRWDPELIQRGFALAERSAEGNELSEYHLEAGIAAQCSAAMPASRWYSLSSFPSAERSARAKPRWISSGSQRDRSCSSSRRRDPSSAARPGSRAAWKHISAMRAKVRGVAQAGCWASSAHSRMASPQRPALTGSREPW